MSDIVKETPLDQPWLELNPLAQFITYEDDKKIIFEFPKSVNIDFYGGAGSYMKYFSDVTIKTWWNGFACQAEKITAIKKVEFMLLEDSYKTNPEVIKCIENIVNTYKKLVK